MVACFDVWLHQATTQVKAQIVSCDSIIYTEAVVQLYSEYSAFEWKMHIDMQCLIIDPQGVYMYIGQNGNWSKKGSTYGYT